jgi:hypothetical protein
LQVQSYYFFDFADYPIAEMPVEILTPDYRIGVEKELKLQKN